MQTKKIINKLLSIFSVLVLFAHCNLGNVDGENMNPEQLKKQTKGFISEVTIGDVKKMIDAKEKIILLDVREKDEFDGGHIPGALNIPRGKLELNVHATIPDKNARIIVYCRSDRRSALATKTMHDLGYKNAVDMINGIKAWEKAGYPIEK